MATKLAGIAGTVNARGSRDSAGLGGTRIPGSTTDGGCLSQERSRPSAGQNAKKKATDAVYGGTGKKDSADSPSRREETGGLQGLCFRLRNETQTDDAGHAGTTEDSARAETAAASRKTSLASKRLGAH